MKKIFLCAISAIAAFLLSASDVSPWDAWRLGYTCFEQGEGFRDRGEYTKALESFNQALEHYNNVRSARPDWNQKVIARRIADCERESERMKRLLGTNESTPEKMEQAGAAALRPASNESMQEIDDLRRQLSEAKAEVENLKKLSGAHRNYEQEITLLLRDQRVARERYLLLERRYRDLELAASEPDLRVEELRKQLLEEKMLSEQLKKKISVAETRRKSDEQRFQKAEAGRRNLEKTLQGKEAAIARLNSESAALREFQKAAGAKYELLERSLEEQKAAAAAVRKEKSQLDAEVQRLRTKLASSAGKSSESSSGVPQDEYLRLTRELDSLRAREQKHVGDAAALQLELEKVKKQNDELVLAVRQGKTAETTVRNEAAALKSENERLRAASAVSAAEIQRLRELNTGLEQDLKTTSDRVSSLDKRLINRDSEDFKRLTASNEERKKLSEKNTALQNDMFRLRADNDTLRNSNQDFKKQLDDLRVQYNKMLAERNRLSEDSKKQLIAIGKLSAAEKDLEILKRDFAALQKENKENRLLVDAAKPREAELAQIKLRLTELDQLKAGLAREQRLNEELKNAVRRLEKERGEAILLRSQLNNANKRIGELEPLIQEIAALKKLNSELAEAKKFEAELIQARAQLNALESTMLELSHVKKLAEKLELEKQELLRQAARDKNLASGMALLSSELESAKNTINELNKDKSLIEKELSLLRKSRERCAVLEAQVERLQKELQAPRQDDYSKQQIAVRDMEIKKLTKQLDIANRTSEAYSADLTSLQKELSGLRLRAAEINVLKKSLNELRNVNRTLREKLAPDKEKVADLMTRNALLSGKEDEAAGLKKQLEALKTELTSFKDDQGRSASAVPAVPAVSTAQSFDSVKKQLDELAKVSRELAAAREKNRQLQEDLSRTNLLKQQLEKAEQSLAAKQRELDNSRLALASGSKIKAEYQQLQQELAALKGTLARANSVVEKQKIDLAKYAVLQETLNKQQSLAAELAKAKENESEFAKAKLKLAEFDQLKQELARVTKYNNELTEIRQRLEKELASRSSFRLGDDAPRIDLDVLSTLPAGKPEDFLASGKIAEADESIELAIWNYEQALKVNPNFIPAARRLGKIMLSRGSFKQAMDLLTTARSANPTDVALSCDTAEAYIGLGRHGNAIAILNPLAVRKGDDYRVQLLLGRALAGAGKNKEAESRLRIAVNRAPAGEYLPAITLAKFILNTDVRRLDEASRIYENVRVKGAAPDVELEPKLGARLDERREVSGFLLSAAQEAEKSGDWKTASWYYRQLIELDREKDKYIPRLAFAQYRGGNSHAAQETLTFNKTTALGELVSALIKLSGKEYPAMVASVRKALALNGGKPIVLPLGWSEFSVEVERVGRSASKEMTDILRRAVATE